MPRFCLYISLDRSDSIAVYTVDSASGELTARSLTQVGQAPGPQTCDARQRFLYVSVRREETVAALAIDRCTGALDLRGVTHVPTDAAYLAVDKAGRHLLAAYYEAGSIAVYPIREDGLIGAQPSAVATTDKRGPHSLQADPTDRFVYVPITERNKILQFRFDEREGSLAPLEPPEINTPSGPNPRHFWFHPQLDVVYFVNEKSSSVSAFRRDAVTGQLSALQTLSTLPAGFSGKSMCAHIEATPDGRFVYASNRGHDSIAIFAADTRSGELALIGHQQTVKRPRAFTLAANGRFLYAGGLDGNELAAYRINSENGTLQPLATYDVGPGPSWIQCVALDE